MSDKRARQEAKRKRRREQARKERRLQATAPVGRMQVQPFATDEIEEFMATLQLPPLPPEQWPERVRDQVAEFVGIARSEGEAVVVHLTPAGRIRATAESIVAEYTLQPDGQWQEQWYQMLVGRQGGADR